MLAAGFFQHRHFHPFGRSWLATFLFFRVCYLMYFLHSDSTWKKLVFFLKVSDMSLLITILVCLKMWVSYFFCIEILTSCVKGKWDIFLFQGVIELLSVSYLGGRLATMEGRCEVLLDSHNTSHSIKDFWEQLLTSINIAWTSEQISYLKIAWLNFMLKQSRKLT